MKKSLIADCSLLLVALIWGATFVIVQNAISFLEPISFNGVRFFLAGLFLFLWLILFHRDQFKAISWQMIGAGFLLGLWLFIGYATQTIGLLYTTSSKAGFITGLSVVLVPLFALILLRQRPTLNAIIGVSIATIGLYLLTMGDTIGINRGDIFVFFCAISFALHIIFTGKFTYKFPTLILTVIQIFTVSILCGIFAIVFENWHAAFNITIITKKEVLLALIITSLFATAFAFFAQTKFQKYTTPTRVALLFATEPVFAAITGFIWNDERLSSIAVLGCLFIFIGMILSEMPQRKKSVKKEMAAS